MTRPTFRDLIVSDDGAEQFQDDLRPDICLDEVLAEYEAEAEVHRERRRAGIEKRVLVVARALQGLTRREVNEVLERGRALWMARAG